MNRRVAVLLACATGAACDAAPPTGGVPDAAPSPDAEAATCPFTANGRGLVEELIGETAFELLLAVGSRALERQVGHFLPGVDSDRFSFFALDHECAGAELSTTCASDFDDGEDPFLSARDACVRLDCLPGGGAAMEAYWTMRPHTEPDDRHPFSYRTTSPPGLASSEPNWLIAWQLEIDEAETRATAALDRALVVTPDQEGVVDLGHAGSAGAVESADGALAGMLAIDFLRLAGDGRPVRLDAELGSDPAEPAVATVSGTLSHGGAAIATFSGRLASDDHPALVWQGSCE